MNDTILYEKINCNNLKDLDGIDLDFVYLSFSKFSVRQIAGIIIPFKTGRNDFPIGSCCVRDVLDGKDCDKPRSYNLYKDIDSYLESVKFDLRLYYSRMINEERMDKEIQELEKEKSIKEDLHGFDKGMTKLRRGKVLSTLMKEIKYNKIINTRKCHIEKMSKLNVTHGYMGDELVFIYLNECVSNTFQGATCISASYFGGKTAIDYFDYLKSINF